MATEYGTLVAGILVAEIFVTEIFVAEIFVAGIFVAGIFATAEEIWRVISCCCGPACMGIIWYSAFRSRMSSSVSEILE